MADPIPYQVSFSFAGWQTINPHRPLPAPELDIELNTASAAIQQLVDSLGDLRRSDARLQNDIVTWDALSGDVKQIIQNTDARVTIGDLNPSAFSTQIEAVAGVADDRLMTPLRTQQAVDSYRAFASQVEAESGGSTLVVMSPARTMDVINKSRAFATTGQAEAGTATNSVLTPQGGTELLDAQRRAHSKEQQLTWGAIAAGKSEAQSMAVAGAQVGDRVIVGHPASGPEAGLVVQAWVDVEDSVRIRVTNVTSSSVTPYGGTAATLNVTAIGF